MLAGLSRPRRRSQPRSLFDKVQWLTGTHRIQRVPPNDKKGRRQSSDVTVVALACERGTAPALDPREIQITTTKGSGPGGQHRNKTESKVVATHIPTGLQASSDDRSQHDNRRQALAVLADRVHAHYASHHAESENDLRRTQMEGERAFTWTEWRDSVVDHRTGRKAKMSKVLRGCFDSLK